MQTTYPTLIKRLTTVWYRHFKVYYKNFFSNAFPPFLEPIIFLVSIGIGLGSYITKMNGIPYITFLASGLLVTSAMYTASFECTFGTFIRMEFDKVYNGMLSAPLTANDLIIGEIIWAGTKGFFFATAVLIVDLIFKIIPLGLSLLTPLVGLLTGLLFGSLSMVITSFASDLNQFNFYFTGFLSPMFFFSGVIFPLNKIPQIIRPLSEIFPLTHSVRLVRALVFQNLTLTSLYDFIFMVLLIIIFVILAIIRLKKRLII